MFPQQASIAPATFPAPIGGINSIGSLSMVGPQESIYSKNIDASAYGLEVRPGFTQYGDDFTGDEVKTVISYLGEASDLTEDFLFACDSDGIWDVSTVPSVPTKDYTWVTSTSDPAGWCTSGVFTNDAGARVLIVCDEANGIVAYTESTQTWAVPTITGATEADLIQLAVWKNRVWYVEKDSTSAWYTASGTYSGAVTEFNFGSRFIKGGHLKAIYNWTLDAGDGPDDFLVAVSSAGDVVVFRGTDPADATTWLLVGVFYVGAFPVGYRPGVKFGGDLLLLSSYGLVRCSDLMQGRNPFTYEGSLSYKISKSLNTLIALTINNRGWEVIVQPDLSKIIIFTPKLSGQLHTQYVYDINIEAWGTWTGIPATTGATYQNDLYTGQSTNIYKIGGNEDDTDTLSTPDPQAISWSFLSGYTDLEMPQMEKCVELIRPRFVGGAAPVISVKAYYDYDLSQIAASIGTATQSEAIWDNGLWDQAVWGGTTDSFESVVGSSGMGKDVAIAMSGKSRDDTTLIDMGLLVRSSIDSKGML